MVPETSQAYIVKHIAYCLMGYYSPELFALQILPKARCNGFGYAEWSPCQICHVLDDVALDVEILAFSAEFALKLDGYFACISGK